MHPLDPLTAEEIRRAKSILLRAGKVVDSTRFPLVMLDEPAKDEVLAYRPGDPIDRRISLLLLDRATGATHEAIVSVTHDTLVSWTDVPTTTPPYGQAPILQEEFELVGDIVKADPRWVAALGKRGITELDRVFVAPLSAGWYDFPGEEGRRLLRALAFAQDHPGTRRGRIRSTAWSPTSTSSPRKSSGSSTTRSCRSRPSPATSTSSPSGRRGPR